MDKELFSARVTDTAELCERRQMPCFLGFLSAEEAAQAEAILKKSGCRFVFYGGYAQAERRYVCCAPDWCEAPDFPITSVTFSFRKCDSLTHRDFLGTLMSLGITRETVGDILVEQGRAVVFLSRDIFPFVLSQINKVGGVGVELSEGFESPLPQMSETVEVSTTVASLRIDCVVGAITATSRTVAAELIENGCVSINSVAVGKCTKTVSAGDRVTVKGKGKFTVCETDGHTKKGRIVLKYTKFV